MMRRFGIAVGLLAMAVMTTGGWTPARADESVQKLDERLTRSAEVFHELMSTPDRGVPQELLERAKCIAVLPHVVKGALVYGVKAGSGVMSCRGEGGWSAPSFITLKGGSIGPQIGAEATDYVLFFMSEHGAQSLMTGSKFTLGGTASVAAGPMGRSGEAHTDLKLDAEIYTYSKSKGLFAGLSLTGARLAADKDANAAYYGKAVTVKQLLFEHGVANPPAGADAFTKALP